MGLHGLFENTFPVPVHIRVLQKFSGGDPRFEFGPGEEVVVYSINLTRARSPTGAGDNATDARIGAHQALAHRGFSGP